MFHKNTHTHSIQVSLENGKINEKRNTCLLRSSATNIMDLGRKWNLHHRTYLGRPLQLQERKTHKKSHSECFMHISIILIILKQKPENLLNVLIRWPLHRKWICCQEHSQSRSNPKKHKLIKGKIVTKQNKCQEIMTNPRINILAGPSIRIVTLYMCQLV